MGMNNIIQGWSKVIKDFRHWVMIIKYPYCDFDSSVFFGNLARQPNSLIDYYKPMKPSPLGLTKMIFDYWAHWMKLSDDDVKWGNKNDPEGVAYYDGYNATFWYILNISFYEMNNKLYARTGCTEPYEILRDFDEDYLIENGYN
jgi:hypothetical protein